MTAEDKCRFIAILVCVYYIGAVSIRLLGWAIAEWRAP